MAALPSPLRGLTIVMFKHPTEPLFAVNLPYVEIPHLKRPILGDPQRSITQPLMRPILVVIQGIGLNDVIQLSEVARATLI